MKKGCLLLLAALLLTASVGGAEKLYLREFSAPEDAAYLNLERLQKIDYDQLVAYLAQFPNLTRVDMYDSPVSAAQADELTALFPKITFGWTIRIPCKDHNHDIRTDATAFSTLHNKRSPQLTSDDFRCLRYCKKLLALDLGHNRLTDLDFLYDLPNLRVLIIAINQVTDITPLASLHDLEYAELFNNRIADLTPLSGLTKLLDLNLSFNAIADWTPLWPLQKLERLWLYSSSTRGPGSKALSDEVLQGLREHLPGAYIDSTHYPTTGGWRDHARYEVIHSMFSSGVYQPFDGGEN